ncbi:AFR540Cp [Eremothecium gossypii ATCC 10895]|uniref:AFR540Cp n=1 Tax=Eremothecium gossypii (strain ATCC 10895 / CBS 109.51 / FGSC 9923 / NRRL Y-1056) TaxID=284811 RepID=Q752N4_EREGS|nr:AFR540Cp [Eremothecium gossypii ATCC 10895]AAS53911.1 AFR540Cp [Eremothecium gossypii ATCC 10895]AEY98224.1 FAFR540Cp [Eremothecium gossypii FDAG1]
MPIEELSRAESAGSAGSGEAAEQNAEKIVTVFDLASEIEQSLNQALEHVEKNEAQFQQTLKDIHERLKRLEQ